MEICESKLFKRNQDFYLYITVEKNVEQKTDCNNVLGVDLGIHNIAVTVNSKTRETCFYGKKLRAVRGHYFHLRRNFPMVEPLKRLGATRKE
ncbi:MAG: hypothetical protein QMD23_02840 [Candidatus Bathyarchaeia archaeon]|nr:hypothetical protein [Candidatus Bathyarchaeia archaeon]